MDRLSTKELLEYILFSIGLIEKRFSTILSSSYFLENEEGLEKLDAISMRLQTIGEALKNVMKNDSEILLSVAPKNYWRDIIKAREIISHHYVDIDAEIVYEICEEELSPLREYVMTALKELSSRNRHT
jgi:uncharacterized protein with HEPN domain